MSSTDFKSTNALPALSRKRRPIAPLTAGITAVLALLLGGCAGTKVASVTTPYGVAGKYDDSQADGIRYYESAPFLLVYTDGKGGLVSKLLFLPDLTRKRVIDPYATLAANNSTLVFTNGVLSQGKSVVDETAVPKAVIGTLEKAVTAALGGTLNAIGSTPTTQLPPPLLFKIVLSGNRARLVGNGTWDKDGKPILIDVTISDPDKVEDKTAKPVAPPPPDTQKQPDQPKKEDDKTDDGGTGK
jgi:hypothetical protein